MTDLVIVRHAESVWNAEGRWQGWADPPLSARGEQQATEARRALRAMTAALGAPDVVAASDLRRARHTAASLAAGLAAQPGAVPPAGEILVDPDLREYDTGEWTGLRRVEIAARWPDELADWEAGRLDRTPGGEDHAAFVARLFEALERLRRAVPAGRVLAVSHGRAIHALADAVGAPSARVGHLAGWRLRLGAAPALVSPVSLLEVPGAAGAAGVGAGEA